MRIAEDGRFEGYASVFGSPDQGGDVVMPGAFAKTLLARGAEGIRLLFQHDPKDPVGRLTSLREDGHGLKVTGQLLTDVPRARALRDLIAGGALDGLSIGFRTVRATRDRASGLRRLWQIDLWEVSIVTFPMMDQARISTGLGLPDNDALKRRISDAISLISNP